MKKLSIYCLFTLLIFGTLSGYATTHKPAKKGEGPQSGYLMSLNITRPPSTNAALAALHLSNGTVSPAFNGATIAYSATVTNVVTAITLTAASADAGATIKINGTSTASGATSAHQTEFIIRKY